MLFFLRLALFVTICSALLYSRYDEARSCLSIWMGQEREAYFSTQVLHEDMVLLVK